MASILRLEQSRTGDERRWLAGLRVSSQCSEVAAAAIAVSGRGLEAQLDVAAALTAPMPRETAGLFHQLATATSCSPGTLAMLRAHLAEVQSHLMADLLAQSGLARGGILALGVDDPGIWRSEGTPVEHALRADARRYYLGLCDPTRLAEGTGLNVIDAFPARDLAQGGLGGPIDAVAQWLLLKDPARGRVLLDLGRTVRMTYLPPARLRDAASRILAFEVGPGTAMLDQLAQRFTGGQHRFDPGGSLAVQGRQIPELVQHWLRDPYFDAPLPRWHPHGIRPERFLADALRLAVDRGWSVRDLLCTATHFIAESIAQTLRRRLPEDDRVDEILVAGGGQHNGLLLREIAARVAVPLVRIPELVGRSLTPSVSGRSEAPSLFGRSETPSHVDDAVGPAAAAVLALCYLDQVPANPTAVTGANVPRLLGRLTPGSPQNWQRLLHALSGSTPTIRPLRSAV
jgi:anhydro-N-acetylmuramic acid kinase